jgi:hypothetical protein
MLKKKNLRFCSVPIFTGSPRALLFIAPLLLEPAAGYPGLIALPGTNFTFHFSPRPDLRTICFLWRENVWISNGTDVPGIEFVSADVKEQEELEEDEDLIPAMMSTATVSKVSPTISQNPAKISTLMYSNPE